MPCRACIERALTRRFSPIHPPRLSGDQLAKLWLRVKQELLQKHGPDVELPQQRSMGTHGVLVRPEGHEQPRICAACDVVFAPRVETAPATAPSPTPAEKKGDPRDLFGLLDVQDLGDDDDDGEPGV